jgi:phenylacetate-coenzyme A ligase PaaK-like adenylate-forming protein
VDADVERTMTNRRLRATARDAARYTAYYHRAFAELSIDPGSLSQDDWGRIPVTPKSALRSMPAAFVSSRSNPVLMASTTGTTGTPTVVWFSAAELEILVALSVIGLSLGEGLRPRHLVALTTSSRATLPLVTTEAAVTRVGASFVQFGTIEPDLALERLAAPMGLPGKASQITHLYGAASNLAALVGAAEAGGWAAEDFGIESIQVGGEILSDALRVRAEEAFGADVASPYQMTEAAPLGGTPCSDGHLHYPSAFGYVEMLDPETFEPAGPGEIAVLVVTPYVPYRDCTLLLRYVTGDLVRVLDAPPTCDFASMPASSAILGRYSGRLSLAAPTRAVLELLEAERAIPLPVRYCLVEDVRGPLLHVAVPHPSAALSSRLEERAGVLLPSLAGIVLHGDVSELPTPVPVRADLREHSFETAGRSRTLIRAAS